MFILLAHRNLPYSQLPKIMTTLRITTILAVRFVYVAAAILLAHYISQSIT